MQISDLWDVRDLALDRDPAAVYLARLTPGGQRTMGEALNTTASLLSGGQADALTCRWSALRFQHTAAIRAKLAAANKSGTANRMLCALRGSARQLVRMLWIRTELGS